MVVGRYESVCALVIVVVHPAGIDRADILAPASSAKAETIIEESACTHTYLLALSLLCAEHTALVLFGGQMMLPHSSCRWLQES